jgi:hypothetical protein
MPFRPVPRGAGRPGGGGGLSRPAGRPGRRFAGLGAPQGDVLYVRLYKARPVAYQGRIGVVARGAAGHASHQESPEVSAAYSSALSRSSASPVVRTLNSQPSPYGSELISEGSSTTAWLTSTTSPLTGE